MVRWLQIPLSSLLVAGGLLTHFGAYADSRIDIQVEQQGAPQQYVAFISNGKVRLLDQTYRTADFIYDASGANQGDPKMIMMDHGQKSYTTITQSKLAELASLVQSVGELARSQGGILGDLMSTFGLDNELGKPAETRVESQPGRETIAGVGCIPTKIIKDGRIANSLCLAGELPISSADQETLRSLLKFSQKLATQAGGVLSALGASVPTMPDTELSGFPLSSSDDQLKARVSQVQSAPTSSDLFRIPQDYIQAELPIG